MIYKLTYIKVGNEYLNHLNQIRLQTNRNSSYETSDHLPTSGWVLFVTVMYETKCS